MSVLTLYTRDGETPFAHHAARGSVVDCVGRADATLCGLPVDELRWGSETHAEGFFVLWSPCPWCYQFLLSERLAARR